MRKRRWAGAHSKANKLDTGTVLAWIFGAKRIGVAVGD